MEKCVANFILMPPLSEHYIVTLCNVVYTVAKFENYAMPHKLHSLHKSYLLCVKMVFLVGDFAL